MSLSGKVCIVTGATRGLGKGIAIQLGENGATVYVTGRTLHPKEDSDIWGSLRETVEAVEARGGVCIPVQCDHSRDEDVEKLFDQVHREQGGRLDVLVNNAFSAARVLNESIEKPFWEHSLSIWDTVNNVGLRNHYICTALAAKMMVARQQGLIVNVSSPAALKYVVNVAYGVGKEAVDRLAVDCGTELRKHNVACLSIWTGGVHTENLEQLLEKRKTDPEIMANESESDRLIFEYWMKGESPQYIGKCIVHLAQDRNVMKKSASVHISMDLGAEYGFVDIDGRKPKHLRQVNTVVSLSPRWKGLASWIPDFVKIPKWVIHMAGNKFY